VPTAPDGFVLYGDKDRPAKRGDIVATGAPAVLPLTAIFNRR